MWLVLPGPQQSWCWPCKIVISEVNCEIWPHVNMIAAVVQTIGVTRACADKISFIRVCVTGNSSSKLYFKQSNQLTRSQYFYYCSRPPEEFSNSNDQIKKLEQLERLHSEIKIKSSYKFQKFAKNSYTQHTFWSCLIRCAHMKWIWLVLWKIQSGHGNVHRLTDRRTDGWTDGQTTWNQYTPFSTSLKRWV